MNQLLSEYSFYYLFLGALLAAGYAWLLYRKNETKPWTKTTNYGLAALRFSLILLLCFLLLNPFVRQIANEYEKPVVVFAIDNSQSVALTADSLKVRQTLTKLEALASNLRIQGFEPIFQDFATLQPDLQAIKFNHLLSPLSDLLQGIGQNYENRNLASIVLLSDGIYNQGNSPLYTNYKTPIYTIGIGDSTPQKDVLIKAVYHNELAYLGNKFPIAAEIYQAGFEGQIAEVTLKQNEQIIDRKTLVFKDKQSFQRLDFLPLATQKGMQHYTIEVQSLAGEFTTKNNIRHLYIDILDGKQKILLLAAAPHPDIKAIRSAVEKKDNYSLDVLIPNISPEGSYKPNEKYDLVIMHNIPNQQGFGNKEFQEYTAKKIPIWYIVGTETNLSALNKQVDFLKINSRGMQYDKVMPLFNSNFNKFSYEESKKAKLKKYPPATTFFATYQLGATAEVILYQQVGNVPTQNPLLLVSDNQGTKTGVLTAEGIWQWRVQEFTQDESQEAFDELVLKTVQYLASKDDKRKFRVKSSMREDNNGGVTFEAETYNDIYENIYGQKIELVITNEKKVATNYNFVNTDANFKYRINGLSQGVYQFRASTTLSGKTETSQGEFTVTEQQTEALSTLADFDLLRQLAKQSGGIFANYQNLEPLQTALQAQKPVSLIHSSETIKEILHLKWLFFVLILLLAVEWFVRKFSGAY